MMRILRSVEGVSGILNDVIVMTAKLTSTGSNHDSLPSADVCYFGGDIQDYQDDMMNHKDNKKYLEWSLERTGELISSYFPASNIFIIRASKFHFGTYACYDHFMKCDQFGAPKHDISSHSLMHLRNLLSNSKSECGLTENNEKLILIGFSKGCVVLNQLLYAIHFKDETLFNFVDRISEMYWLDGGHPGGGNTWITNKNVLESLSHTAIKVHIDVTPYQMNCSARPWIGHEEKIFRETLESFSVPVHRKLHFSNEEEATIEMHLKVLKVFKDKIIIK